jgi:hypothetical protein
MYFSEEHFKIFPITPLLTTSVHWHHIFFWKKKTLLTIALCCVENLQLPTNIVIHIYLESTFGA